MNSELSIAFWTGRVLLGFGMMVIALQALSEIALAWCVAAFGCTLREQPEFYRYIYGILPVCLGVGIIAFAPLADAVVKLIERRQEKSQPAVQRKPRQGD
jgi:hypothetical protein